MSETEQVTKAEDTLQSRSRFAFLLRPWFLAVVTVFVILVAAAFVYRSTRFSGIPPIDEIVDLEAEVIVPVSDDENAFTYYRSAVSMLPPVPKGLDLRESVTRATQSHRGWAAVRQEEREYLNSCEAALVEWQLGTEFRDRVFVPDMSDEFPEVPLLELQTVGLLADLRALQCLNDGKTEEAWHWLRALLRSSRHLGQNGHLIDRLLGAALHEMAAQTIVTWAEDERVSPEDAQRALIEVREIYGLTVANSLHLKKQYHEFVRLLSSHKDVQDDMGMIQRQLTAGHLFLNGEPDLCRILMRHVYVNLLSQCDLPRRERTIAGTRRELFLPTGSETPPLMDVNSLDDGLARSVLARMVFPGIVMLVDDTDEEQATQTALELCLTAELYRRKSGAYPDSLDALVPEFLDEVPRDLFGTVPTDRILMIRRPAQPAEPSEEMPGLPPALIIYSRGVNGLDEAGPLKDRDDIGLRIALPETVE